MGFYSPQSHPLLQARSSAGLSQTTAMPAMNQAGTNQGATVGALNKRVMNAHNASMSGASAGGAAAGGESMAGFSSSGGTWGQVSGNRAGSGRNSLAPTFSQPSQAKPSSRLTSYGMASMPTTTSRQAPPPPPPQMPQMQMPQAQQQPINVPGLNVPAAPSYNFQQDPNQDLQAIGQRQQQFTEGLGDFSGEVASNVASQQALAGAGGENAAVLSALQRGADPKAAKKRAGERSQRNIQLGQAGIIPQMAQLQGQSLGQEAGTAATVGSQQLQGMGQQIGAAGQLGQYNLGAAGLQSQHGLQTAGLQQQANYGANQQQLGLLQAMRSSPMYNPYNFAGMGG